MAAYERDGRSHKKRKIDKTLSRELKLSSSSSDDDDEDKDKKRSRKSPRPAGLGAKTSGKNAGQMLAEFVGEDLFGSSSSGSSRSSSSSSSSGSEKNSPEPARRFDEYQNGIEPPRSWDNNLGKDYPTGLEHDYKLEKICKAHRTGFTTFIVVKWKDHDQVDLVSVKDMINLYSGELLAYLAELKHSSQQPLS